MAPALVMYCSSKQENEMGTEVPLVLTVAFRSPPRQGRASQSSPIPKLTTAASAETMRQMSRGRSHQLMSHDQGTTACTKVAPGGVRMKEEGGQASVGSLERDGDAQTQSLHMLRDESQTAKTVINGMHLLYTIATEVPFHWVPSQWESSHWEPFH